MATTTFQGIVRSNGGAGKGNATPSVVTLSEVISFDPTAASATNVRIGTSSSSGETFVLPTGAVPVSFMTIGGATGGTNPLVLVILLEVHQQILNTFLQVELHAGTKGTLTTEAGAALACCEDVGDSLTSATVTGHKLVLLQLRRWKYRMVYLHTQS